MNNREQMQNFIKGLKSQTRMVLDAFAGGLIRQMIEPQIKDLIEKMCTNAYCVKTERCLLEGTSEEVQFANFQNNNLYSNTYNSDWKHHPNFRWNNNPNSNANQGMQQSQQALFQRKPTQWEETLYNFIKVTQSSFEQVTRNHEILSRNHDASIKNLKTQIGQLSRQIVALPSSSVGFTGTPLIILRMKYARLWKWILGWLLGRRKLKKLNRIKLKKRKGKLKRRRVRTKVMKRKEESPLINL
ncbi:hypothetical protein KIW84_076542 [Lathyrus oleraceus]|uniref:Uncharacterized protein n=1 Tax=Pisum sativum TaxID=3888 RepID=A0A9D4VWT1_PEA|nr:hypothetical protein KIW84_076542 [Pisum sativum]